MSSIGSSGTPPAHNRTTRIPGRHSFGSATSGVSFSPQNVPSVVGSRLNFDISPCGHEINPGRIETFLLGVKCIFKSIYCFIKLVLRVIKSVFTKKGYIEAPVDESLLRSFDVTRGRTNSFYAKMFPGIKLDCHRCLIPWVGTYSDDASDLLDAVLPIEGPVVSIDLAYLLSAIVLKYDLKVMFLPNVYEASVLGAKFLHFDDDYRIPVRDLIVKLMNFNGYVGAGGIDPMHMINTAAAVGAATIASNQASTMFRNQLDHMVEVNTMLTEEEEEWLKRDRSQVYFSKNREISHDHPYLAACREIVRYDFDKTFNLKTTDFSTLILGSGSREYKKYNANASVSFQFAGLEGKDSERILVECLNSVKSLRLKKIRKAKNRNTADTNLQRLKTVDQVMDEFKKTRKMPDRILLWSDTKDMMKGKLSKTYSILVFQDVGYNFSKDDWGNLFRHTGALMAYGYMCLPWELIYPEIVAPPGYVYRVRGDTSYMGYHGYSNGYVHKTNTWKTLMNHVIMRCGDFNIGVEFVSRVGPMTLIKLFRCETEEQVARHIELPEHLKSVLVLDVHESYDRMRSNLDMNNLVYFPVRAEEFNEAVNYGLDISKNSLDFPTILLYIRRRTSGISLVTKNIAKTWTVPAARVPPFSMTVYLYVRFLSNEYLSIQEHVDQATFTIAGQYLFSYGKKVRVTIRDFFDLFRRHDMFTYLIKNTNHSMWQESASKLSVFRKKKTMLDVGPSTDPFLDDKFNMKEEDEDLFESTCAFCEELKEVTGEQLFKCERDRDEEVFHTFTLNSSELNKLRTSLNDTTKDPIGLKSVKETAARFVPLSTFEHRIRVKYICGPPGTGKSRLIRSLATSQSLVLVPFSRLKADYTNFIHPITGKKASLRVQTQHAAFTALNHARVFVDEYTAMPYEYLSVILYNCGADEVVFVGDHRQTTLINEIEGISIDSRIKMTDLRSHELIKNFRNPSDAVNVLNRSYGYTMLSTNKRVGFKFDEPENFDKYPDHTPLFFTNATAKSFGISNEIGDRVTVRANQGATYDNVKLVVSGADVNLFSMSSMGIVALSRHREQCVIFIEKGTGAVAFGATVSTSMRRVTKISPLNISPSFSREEQIKLMEGNNLENQPLGESEAVVTEDEPNDNPGGNQSNNGGSDDDKDEDDDKPPRGGGGNSSGCKPKPKNNDDDSNDGDSGSGGFRSYFSMSKLTGWFRGSNVNTSKSGSTTSSSRQNEPATGDNNDQQAGDLTDKEDGSNSSMPELVSISDEDDPAVGVVNTEETAVEPEVSVDSSFSEGQTIVTQDTGNMNIPLLPTPVGIMVQDIGVVDLTSKGTGDTNTPLLPTPVAVIDQDIITTDLTGNDLGVVDVSSTIGNSEIDGTLIVPELTLQGVTDETVLPVTTINDPIDLEGERSTKETAVKGGIDWESLLQGVNPIHKVTIMGLVEGSVSDSKIVTGEQPSQVKSPNVRQITSGLLNQGDSKVVTIDIALSKMDGPLDLKMQPDDNNCLLKCLSEITVNTMDVVWSSMLLALGDEKARAVYNRPLSTDELNIFCNFNKFSLMVVSDFVVLTCGIVSNYLGTICHSNQNGGHFYLRKGCTCKPTILRTDLSFSIDTNSFGEQVFTMSRWNPTFTYSEQTEQSLTPDQRSNMVSKLSSEFYWNNITTNSICDIIGAKKEPGTYTMKEVLSIVQRVPLSSTQLTSMILLLKLTKNKRFWNELKTNLSKTQPYTHRLEGSGNDSVKSFNTIQAHMLKEAPPAPFKNIDKGFEEMARLFAKPVFLKNWLVDHNIDSEFQHVPIEQSPYDSFKMLVEEFATAEENDFVLANQESIGYIENKFGNGVFDMTTLDGLNQRNNPKTTLEKSWCLLNVAPGVTYYKGNLSQSLYCLQTRYLTQAYVSVFSTKSVDKAREIADLFYDEHMVENYDIFNEQDLDITSYESEHAMVMKNYDKQATFEMCTDNSVRFSMKDIFKPFKTKVDLFKAGQGISAWSKDMQTIFQTSFRMINKHFINSLRPHVVYDNGIDEYELMSRINLLFAQLPDVAINGVIDATACDSGQNLFTQQIERRILERLSIDGDFLDWYYQQRESYILKGYGVIAKVKEIKTSGEPATLLNNTILMACLMNYIVRGEGPCVVVIKGDDGLKRQANMCYRASVVEDLKNFLKMKFKVDIDVPITFCGYFLAGSSLLPDIVRKCFKIIGHKFRDYEHFCEYQQSLRDWVLVVNKLGLTKIVQITSENYGFRGEYCFNLFYSIVSLTHIGKKQFYKNFKYRVIDLKEDFIPTEPWSEKLQWYKGNN